jgi:hypothetical protein
MHGELGMQPFEDGVLVVRHNRVVLAVAIAPVVLGAALAVGGVLDRAASAGLAGLVGLGLATVWVGAGGLLYAWARNPGSVERPARARADRRGLYLDGVPAAVATRVRGGWVQPQPHGPPVVYVRVRRRTRLELVVRDIAHARALLDALGVDAVRAPARFWAFARPLGGARELKDFARVACALALLIALGMVVGQAVPLASALATMAMLALFGGLAVPTRVTVGADGVLLGWLGTERFVSWSTVAAIEPFDGGVVVALASGHWLTLRTPAAHQRHHPEGEAMIERMRVAWRACASAEPDEAVERLLRREGGRTREWVRAMRGLLRSEDGYRCAAMPAERLWRVVEDAGADATARIGAAVALASSLDPDGRARLRAAADACVEPRVRVMLTTTATIAGAHLGDEDLAAALDAVDEAEGAGTRGGGPRDAGAVH